MYHLVARVHEGKRIFKCWAEGLLLWRMIAARVPLRALIIMSTHLHVIVRSPRERELLGRGRAVPPVASRGMGNGMHSHRLYL